MDPTKEEALERASNLTHVTSDGLAAVMVILLHLGRNYYTREELLDYLLGNSEIVPPSPGA